MNYVGVDIHKRYSVLVAVDERGRELRRSRINGNTAFGFAQFFLGLEGKSKVVLEACWNWGRIYDLLSEIEQVEEVVLAHPLKTRLIADAQIKTDALDAHALATLLRGDLIARAYVPAKPTRQRKEVLRQRLYWARLRTRVRNRIHALIDRQRELSMPQCSDLFGRKGLSALTKLVLSEPDATLLREDLELLGLIQQQIKAQEARIVEFNHTDETTLRLQTLPGMGKILAAVAAAEIDCVQHFSQTVRLCRVGSADPRQWRQSLSRPPGQEP
jgi:transposase